MMEYINPNAFIVHLTGPDGVVIKVKPYSKIILSDYFDKYRARGFIKLVSSKVVEQVEQTTIKRKPQSKIYINRTEMRKQNQHSTDEQRQLIQQSTQTRLDEESKKHFSQ